MWRKDTKNTFSIKLRSLWGWLAITDCLLALIYNSILWNGGTIYFPSLTEAGPVATSNWAVSGGGGGWWGGPRRQLLLTAHGQKVLLLYLTASSHCVFVCLRLVSFQPLQCIALCRYCCPSMLPLWNCKQLQQEPLTRWLTIKGWERQILNFYSDEIFLFLLKPKSTFAQQSHRIAHF